MKITRSELQKLINEEVAQSNSVLLEMPVHSTTGMTMGGLDNAPDPENTEDKTAMNLFHIMNQAQTLHALVSGYSAPDVDDGKKKVIAKVAKLIDDVFKHVTHETTSQGVQE